MHSFQEHTLGADVAGHDGVNKGLPGGIRAPKFDRQSGRGACLPAPAHSLPCLYLAGAWMLPPPVVAPTSYRSHLGRAGNLPELKTSPPQGRCYGAAKLRKSLQSRGREGRKRLFIVNRLRVMGGGMEIAIFEPSSSLFRKQSSEALNDLQRNVLDGVRHHRTQSRRVRPV